MNNLIVVIGPGSIGQAIARRVSAGKHVLLADLKKENADRALDKNQPGDPSKLAKAIMTAMNSEKPPLRLLGGKAAVQGIDQYLNARKSEYETWREISKGTDFDNV